MASKLKIVIVGCGIVGAMIAYEMSRQIEANITVLDRQLPAQGSTGAALGVLMAAISGKVRGRTWRLREASMRRYQSLMVELAEQGYEIPFNTHGIVSLCFDDSKLPRWQTLQTKRAAQGWPLEIWTPSELKDQCPQVNLHSASLEHDRHSIKAAIYSAADGQVHPVKLTQALVAAAKSRGVTFHNNAEVTALDISEQHCTSIQTNKGHFDADWIVLSAGIGSAVLTCVPNVEPLALMPVLGQAMKIQLSTTLGRPEFQPVINGDDIQFVPLGNGQYWVGATVEFPNDDVDSKQWLSSAISNEQAGAEDGIAKLQHGIERFIDMAEQAVVLESWHGLRPRPVGQPAPVIKPLGDLENVTLATGHYRNGVLLAPATAQQVCDLLKEQIWQL